MPPWTVTVLSNDLLNRAGDTSDTLLSTPTPSPTPSSSSNSNSDLPKIGGSFGGFVALVVVLAAIVVFCCIAVFILLHKHNPDPYDKHFRRVMAGKRESSIYETPLGPHGMRAKFKNMIGHGKKSQGWMKANNGDDEWDASDRNLVPDSLRGPVEADTRTSDPPFSPPRPGHAASIRRSSTSESIELSVPATSPLPPFDNSRPAAAYSDPFVSPSDPVFSMVPTGQATLQEPGRFAVRSGNNGTVHSMQKFDSGTKFKEALDLQ